MRSSMTTSQISEYPEYSEYIVDAPTSITTNINKHAHQRRMRVLVDQEHLKRPHTDIIRITTSATPAGVIREKKARQKHQIP